MSPKDFAKLVLQEDQTLAGKKYAVLVGKTLYVGPALLELLTKEEGAARDRVIEAIEVVVKEPPKRRKWRPF